MSSARIELQPAWLLSQKPYRETSELLEVLTPQHGRVGLVARGLRGPRAKQRGVVSLFRPLLLSWLDKGELGTVTAVEAGGPEVQLVGERLFHGWYLNELLLKLLPRHDPHPALYRVYADSLQLLAGSALEAEAALRLFELRALEELGYGLPLAEAFDEAGHYRYLGDRGFVACAEGTRGALAGVSLNALRAGWLDSRAVLDDARRLLRAALEPQVPHASLRTPQLLREMRAFGSNKP
ncbi:DNA repair protein RecO [Nevskia sp.]|uniref:DNA repair protein RecO n=1 Tax=Nevskia sp. TaxID=1929292 RepID=UPI0025CDC5E9|nr:DNA repair protein RecO [Nevskia sp.]